MQACIALFFEFLFETTMGWATNNDIYKPIPTPHG